MRHAPAHRLWAGLVPVRVLVRVRVRALVLVMAPRPLHHTTQRTRGVLVARGGMCPLCPIVPCRRRRQRI